MAGFILGAGSMAAILGVLRVWRRRLATRALRDWNAAVAELEACLASLQSRDAPATTQHNELVGGGHAPKQAS